jgi:hypothetical protein
MTAMSCGRPAALLKRVPNVSQRVTATFEWAAACGLLEAVRLMEGSGQIEKPYSVAVEEWLVWFVLAVAIEGEAVMWSIRRKTEGVA